MNLLKRILILNVIVFSGQLAAQNYIDSLKIIPQNPDTTDQVFVACYTTFPRSNCGLVSSSKAFDDQNDRFIFTTHYRMGDTNVTCHTADTLRIALLPAVREFSVAYIIWDHDERTKLDTDTIWFKVSAPTGVWEQVIDPSLIEVYPNPAKENIYFEIDNTLKNSIQTIEMYSLTGSTIRNYPATTRKINISSIDRGHYFLIIQTDKGEIYRAYPAASGTCAAARTCRS